MFSLPIIFSLITYKIFMEEGHNFIFFSDFRYQFIFLLICSSCLSLYNVYRQKNHVFTILLKLLFAILMTIPISNVYLILLILLDLVFFIDSNTIKIRFFVSVMAILLLFVFQFRTLVYGVNVSTLKLSDFVFLSFTSIAFSFYQYSVFNTFCSNRALDRLYEKANQTISRMIECNAELIEFSRFVEGKSKRDERLRISRDLHDIVGHSLTNISMMQEESLDALKNEKYQECIDLVNSTKNYALKTHKEIRYSLINIRKEPIHQNSLLSSIYNMINIFQEATNVQVNFNISNMKDIKYRNKKYENCIYHFIQEGLTNSFKHGQATIIDILLVGDGKKIKMFIRDNGIGSDESIEGIGIEGMRERFAEVGGELFMHGSVNTGYELSAIIPYDE